MKTTLSEKENALEETVETPVKTVMVRYNESQREKTSWSERVDVSQLPIYMNDTGWFTVCSNNMVNTVSR